jgi:hypothetical protein
LNGPKPPEGYPRGTGSNHESHTAFARLGVEQVRGEDVLGRISRSKISGRAAASSMDSQNTAPSGSDFLIGMIPSWPLASGWVSGSYDLAVDEAISFLREFLDALYRVSHAKLSEPDDMKFTALVRAADAFYEGKNFGSGGSRPLDDPPELFESEMYRTAAANLTTPQLFAIAQYQHDNGPLYRAWTGTENTGERGSMMFYNYYVQRREDAHKVIARYMVCLSCMGGGIRDGGICRSCESEGWEFRAGARLDNRGPLVEVRKLEAPVDPQSHPAYEVIGQ